VCVRFSLWHKCVPFCLSFFASVGFQYYLYVTCVCQCLCVTCVCHSLIVPPLYFDVGFLSYLHIYAHKCTYIPPAPLFIEGGHRSLRSVVCLMPWVMSRFNHRVWFICATWLLHVWHASSIYAPIWRSNYSHKMQLYAWHDSLIHYLARRLYKARLAHKLYVTRLILCVIYTGLIYAWDMRIVYTMHLYTSHGRGHVYMDDVYARGDV